MRGLEKLIDIKIKPTNLERHKVEKAKYKMIRLTEDEQSSSKQTQEKILRPFGSLELVDLDLEK